MHQFGLGEVEETKIRFHELINSFSQIYCKYNNLISIFCATKKKKLSRWYHIEILCLNHLFFFFLYFIIFSHSCHILSLI